MPSDAFSDVSKFALSLGVAARFAVYDFTGYYDVCFVGTEVQDPRKTIPLACVGTCVVIAMCFFLVDVAVIGSLEWDPDKGGYVELVTSGAESANFIMALFCETHIGRGFAIFFTIIVVITIFGSCFSFMIGLAQIPYTAAKDGYFYDFLAHEHPVHKGLQDYYLLLCVFGSCHRRYAYDAAVGSVHGSRLGFDLVQVLCSEGGTRGSTLLLPRIPRALYYSARRFWLHFLDHGNLCDSWWCSPHGTRVGILTRRCCDVHVVGPF